MSLDSPTGPVRELREVLTEGRDLVCLVMVQFLHVNPATDRRKGRPFLLSNSRVHVEGIGSHCACADILCARPFLLIPEFIW